MRSGCCARATGDQAIAAPPSADMNCRLPVLTAIRSFPNGINLAAM
jgi:hypothetical protein